MVKKRKLVKKGQHFSTHEIDAYEKKVRILGFRTTASQNFEAVPRRARIYGLCILYNSTLGLNVTEKKKKRRRCSSCAPPPPEVPRRSCSGYEAVLKSMRQATLE